MGSLGYQLYCPLQGLGAHTEEGEAEGLLQDCQRLSYTVTDCQRQPKSATDCHKLPQTAIDIHRLQQPTTDYHRLQQTASDCKRLPQTTNCKTLSHTLKNCHRMQ